MIAHGLNTEQATRPYLCARVTSGDTRLGPKHCIKDFYLLPKFVQKPHVTVFVRGFSLSFVTAQCYLQRAVAFFPMAGNHLLVTLITCSSITVVHANITVLDCLTLGQKLSHCERDIIPMSQMISYRLRSFSADQTTITFSSLLVLVATISRLNSKYHL